MTFGQISTDVLLTKGHFCATIKMTNGHVWNDHIKNEEKRKEAKWKNWEGKL